MKILDWLILSTAFILSGCGGGGSNGGSGSATVSPTYATLDTLTSATTFATTGAVFNYYDPNTPEPIDTTVGATVSIAYDPATKTYSLSGTPFGSTSQDIEAFGPADLQSDGIYSQSTTTADATITSGGRLDITKITSAINNISNTYSAFGEWDTGSSNNSTCFQNFNTYVFTYGIGTQAGDLPRAGTASYPLEIKGETPPFFIAGAGTLTIDFTAGTASLTITPAIVNESEDGVISLTPIATLVGSGSIDFTTNSSASM